MVRSELHWRQPPSPEKTRAGSLVGRDTIVNCHVTALAALLVALLLGTTGCVVATGANAVDRDHTAQLTLTGADHRVLGARTTIEVEVHYQHPYPDAHDRTVLFAIEDAANGARLSARAVRPDDDGYARVELTTGGAATFDVIIRAPWVSPMRIQIEVLSMERGAIEVEATYRGARTVERAEVGLFPNTTCDGLRIEPERPLRVVSLGIRARHVFDHLRIGIPHAIYAIGLGDDDEVAAESCIDWILESERELARLELRDRVEAASGVYDVAYGVNLSVGGGPLLTALRTEMSELAHDPASHAVTRLHTGDDTAVWLREKLASPSRRMAVTQLLRDALDGVHGESYMRDIRDTDRRLRDSLAAVTLRASLSFGDPSGELGVEGHQALFALETTDRGMPIELPLSSSSLVQVHLDRDLSVSSHRSHLPLGLVVERVLNDVVLYGVPGSPGNVSDMVKDVFDCDPVSEWLSEQDNPDRGLAAQVCEHGRNAVMGDANQRLDRLWDFTEVLLDATADPEDTDGDYDYDTLRDGRSTVGFRVGTVVESFNGTFEGARTGDETSSAHPIWEQMSPAL